MTLGDHLLNRCACPLDAQGYIDVILPGGRERNILHPAYPGSVYHATKCLDALLFQFYAKNDQLRITDLHQGIVWGTNTVCSLLSPPSLADPAAANVADHGASPPSPPSAASTAPP